MHRREAGGILGGVSRILAVALLALALAAVAEARPRVQPALRVVRAPHLVVRGISFAGREQVRVTVIASERRTKTVRTGSAGTFTADFGPTFVDPCDAWSIRAVGKRGDRALLKLPARACSSG